MKHYVVLLDRDRIPGELRIPEFDHVWVEHPHTPPDACVDHLWRATIGVTHDTPITAQVLAGCPKLRCLLVTGASLDVVDAAACRERGIAVRHLPPDGDAVMDAIEDCARGLA
ncbi:MAG: hypothetical protein AB1831_04010 [Pseudomonadota bacterium]